MSNDLLSLMPNELTALNRSDSKLRIVRRLAILEKEEIISHFAAVSKTEEQNIPGHSILKSAGPEFLRNQIHNAINIPKVLEVWFQQYANGLTDKELAMYYHGLVQLNVEDLCKLTCTGEYCLVPHRDRYISVDKLLFAYCYTYLVDGRISGFSNRLNTPQAKRGNLRLRASYAQRIAAHQRDIADSNAILNLNSVCKSIPIYCIYEDILAGEFKDELTKNTLMKLLTPKLQQVS